MVGHVTTFGPFRLLATQRLLLEGDTPVRLGSRAFDILAALVERAGEVVGKEELIARAWPQTIVEESNLKIQISALRRALGDGQGDNRYVITVPGRGYNFVAPVRHGEPAEAPLPQVAPASVHNLPFAMTRMIGREEAETALVSRVRSQRLVTVVGPGGIGKTTVALAVAERMIAEYEHGVWLVDLAALGDPRLVPSTVATVLGLEIQTENPLMGLIAALRHRRMLLLLDNCEHVIDAAASLAAAVLSKTPGVNILATSREPLRVVGEREHRLGPLGSPPTSSGLTADEAAAFPAVQLFVERVTAIVEDFALTDANASMVVEICQRLDGLPLAIEFAAPRVKVLGVEGLAVGLDRSLPLLTGRRRTPQPRHRTMRAVVDWSYGLLNEDEQRFFGALGIFSGGFTVEAAAAVAIDAADAPCEAIDRLADLVAKSLVVADVSGAKPRFRLLHTTRAYAIDQLDESNGRDRIARRHAKYYLDLFERAESETAAPPSNAWLADYAQEIGNLRAALDWASSASGIPELAAALTVAAFPLWLHLSLFEECHRRVDYALSSIAVDKAETVRPRMRLNTALATSLFYTRGAIPEVKSAWQNALLTAERLDETDYQLRALWGLWSYSISAGDYREADQRGRHFHQIASHSSNPGDLLIAQRMIGGALHFLGDQTAARRHIEAMLSHYVESLHRPNIMRFHYDQRLAAQVTLARILWAQGLPEQASRAATRGIEQAETSRQPISLCFALNEAAIPVALFTGDWTSADRYLTTLHGLSDENDFAVFRARAIGSKGLLAAKRGDPRAGAQMIRDALYELDKGGYHAYPLLLGGLADALRTLGDIEGGVACVDAALARCERTGERWYTADLLRIKGELTLKSSDPEAPSRAAAEFNSSLDCAHQQGALSWELRAATSLARLLQHRGCPDRATGCLQAVYDRFTEGFGTADLVAAKQLLDDLASAPRN